MNPDGTNQKFAPTTMAAVVHSKSRSITTQDQQREASVYIGEDTVDVYTPHQNATREKFLTVASPFGKGQKLN